MNTTSCQDSPIAKWKTTLIRVRTSLRSRDSLDEEWEKEFKKLAIEC